MTGTLIHDDSSSRSVIISHKFSVCDEEDNEVANFEVLESYQEDNPEGSSFKLDCSTGDEDEAYRLLGIEEEDDDAFLELCADLLAKDSSMLMPCGHPVSSLKLGGCGEGCIECANKEA